MSITSKPIKRSKQLAPLSREHHDGLLLCWKIRTGLRNNIATERIVSYILHFYETDLKLHFLHEEDILFSLLPGEDPMRKEALMQHGLLNDIITILKQEDSDKKDRLYAFADALDEHIRFEERQLFGYIEENVETVKLNKVGKQLNELYEQHCELVWEDEFWNYKK